LTSLSEEELLPAAKSVEETVSPEAINRVRCDPDGIAVAALQPCAACRLVRLRLSRGGVCTAPDSQLWTITRNAGYHWIRRGKSCNQRNASSAAAQPSSTASTSSKCPCSKTRMCVKSPLNVPSVFSAAKSPSMSMTPHSNNFAHEIHPGRAWRRNFEPRGCDTTPSAQHSMMRMRLPDHFWSLHARWPTDRLRI
jgi:hypothetical protein